jgi:hypothetical protein
MKRDDVKKDQIEMIQDEETKSDADVHLETPDLFMDIEHIPRRYIWRSCCLMLDSRAVLFFSQLAISATIVMFCIHQMSILSDTESQRNYGMLLTFIVGLWFPAPRIGQ